MDKFVESEVGVCRNKEIYLWGAGSILNRSMPFIESICKIKGIFDKNADMFPNGIKGYPVLKPEKIVDLPSENTIFLITCIHGSRFGYSILKNIGLEDLAVQTEAEYVAKAVALAGDWELLDLLHKQLRNRMLDSPLMNERFYVGEIENIYKKIWQEKASKLAVNIGK